MTTRPRLLPCPFCGSKGRYVAPAHSSWWNAGCAVGHATSPDFPTAEEAAAWWNRRWPRRRDIPQDLPAATGEAPRGLS